MTLSLPIELIPREHQLTNEQPQLMINFTFTNGIVRVYVVMIRDDEKMVHKRWDVKECSARDFFFFCVQISYKHCARISFLFFVKQSTSRRRINQNLSNIYARFFFLYTSSQQAAFRSIVTGFLVLTICNFSLPCLTLSSFTSLSHSHSRHYLQRT